MASPTRIAAAVMMSRFAGVGRQVVTGALHLQEHDGPMRNLPTRCEEGAVFPHDRGILQPVAGNVARDFVDHFVNGIEHGLMV